MYPVSVSAMQHSNVTFSCTALGGPFNTFNWKKEGDDTIISSDAKLTLIDVQAFDGGEYSCSVANPAGEDNATVTLNGKCIYTTFVTTVLVKF